MPRTRCRIGRIWWILILLILLVPQSAAQAQSKTLYWESYNVDITLQASGDLAVTETQTLVFTRGSFTYGYRTIPLEKTDGIVDLQMWEGDQPFAESSSGNAYTFEHHKEGGDLVVHWYFPPTSNSRHTYSFAYTVKGGVEQNDQEGDRIFWKAIPSDHSFPIQLGRVAVHFPEGIDLGDIVSFGVPAEYSAEGNTVIFASTRALSAGEELEVGVAFDPQFVQAEKPDWQKSQERGEILSLVLGVIGALVMVAGPLGILLLWYMRGRDPQVGLVADILSEPPSDLPPGIAGTLIDERADIQDVTSSLVDLARRGYLEMIETKESQGFLGLGTGSQFTFRRTHKSWDGLLPYERTILDKVFSSGDEPRLSDLQNKFYTAIPKIKKGLYQQTVGHQFFRTDPDTVRGRYAGLGIGLLVVTAGIGFLVFSLLNETVGAVICPFISLGVTAVVAIIVGQAMPVKTRQGAEEAARWKAFKRYLQGIERYTNLEEATEVFDLYLPYAIAFGIERSWINKFAAVPATPIPIWYHPVWLGRPSSGQIRGGGDRARGGQVPSLDGMSKGMATGLSGMSAGLASMLNTASSALVSRPQSSGGGGGGGWSGGGFSGGGGGGGGSVGFG